MKDHFEINLLVAMLKDGERHFAYSPHIRVVGFGTSSETALIDFDRAVKDWIKFYSTNGTLHARLINLGWNFQQNNQDAPKAPKEWSVPTHLLANLPINRTVTKTYDAAYC